MILKQLIIDYTHREWNQMSPKMKQTRVHESMRGTKIPHAQIIIPNITFAFKYYEQLYFITL